MEEIRFIDSRKRNIKCSPSPCERCRTGAKMKVSCRYQVCASWRSWFDREWRDIQLIYARNGECQCD